MRRREGQAWAASHAACTVLRGGGQAVELGEGGGWSWAVLTLCSWPS